MCVPLCFLPYNRHLAGRVPFARYVRALLVGWITVLDSVPDIEMLDWLPQFLEGLFDMLSDGNREIRQVSLFGGGGWLRGGSSTTTTQQQAYQALATFLEEINRIPPEEFDKRVDFRPMIEVLSRQCRVEEKFNRVTAVWWLHQFILLGRCGPHHALPHALPPSTHTHTLTLATHTHGAGGQAAPD